MALQAVDQKIIDVYVYNVDDKFSKERESYLWMRSLIEKHLVTNQEEEVMKESNLSK